MGFTSFLSISFNLFHILICLKILLLLVQNLGGSHPTHAMIRHRKARQRAWLSQCILLNPCIRDESDELIGSTKGLSWGYIAEGLGKSIECWRRFISLPMPDQANILHGIRGGWTNALLLREGANQRMTWRNG